MTTAPACRAPVHDTLSAYQQGCTHLAARLESARYARQLRADHAAGTFRLVCAVDTAYQLRDLCAAGYSFPWLGAQLGQHPDALRSIAHHPERHVRRSTRDAVATLYTTLAGTPGPSARARHAAAANGWVLPHRWRRLSATEHAALNVQVIRELAGRGLGDKEIAERLSWYRYPGGYLAVRKVRYRYNIPPGRPARRGRPRTPTAAPA